MISRWRYFRGLESQLQLMVSGTWGKALGSPSFVNSFVEERVSAWARERFSLIFLLLISMLLMQHLLMVLYIGKWSYLMRCIPNIQGLLAPLEVII